jgi:hypothetical protein
MSDFPYAVPIWPFAAIGMLGGLVILVWMSIPAARGRHARRMAREQGLELDDLGARVVGPYYVRRLRLTAVGFIVVCGTVLVIAALGMPLPFQGTEFWVAGAWAVIPLVTVGGGIGVMASGLRWPRTSSGTAALGRLTPPTRADVVAPWEERLQLAAVTVGAALPAIVLATRLGDGRAEPIAALVLGALGVLTTVGWRAAADRVLRRRPISGDLRSLAWSDALRSDAIRFGMPVPAALAASAYALILGTIAAALESSGNRFGGVLLSFGVAVIAIGLAGVTIGQLATGASRRWHRLRPANPAGPALSEGGPA